MHLARFDYNSFQSYCKRKVNIQTVCVGHGAKRKRSIDDQGQTTKRQKTGAR